MIDAALPTARDCMSTEVFIVSPDAALFDAMDELLAHSFAAAPVVDKDRRLLGMLTEKDCLRVLSHLIYGNGRREAKVRDFLSELRVTVEPDMEIFRVAELFLATNFPLLPVVEDGRLVGVVSRRDTLRGVRALRRELMRQEGLREALAGHQADRPSSIENMQRTFASQSREQLVSLFQRR